MRRLYFGGSFNPIHNGHIRCAAAAAEVGKFEQVVLVPSGQAPHKPDFIDIARGADRLAMCKLVAEANPLFTVDELELERTGPSYTLDTVRALKARGCLEINWLIGADMLLFLPQWHAADQLLSEVNFVIVARPGWTLEWELLPERFRRLRENVVTAPLLDISSTEVRRRVAVGESIGELVPGGVERYIRERGLYRAASR